MEENIPPVVAVPSTSAAPAAAESIPTASPALDRAAIVQADQEILNGANWFWWIAGLTLVNTILMQMKDNETTMAIGLGFTLFTDAMFKEVKVVALVIDVLALATICGLGFFARKGHLWAFVVGIVLYSLDSLIFLLVQMWIGLAIHAFAVFSMTRAALKLRAALKTA